VKPRFNRPVVHGIRLAQSNLTVVAARRARLVLFDECLVQRVKDLVGEVCRATRITSWEAYEGISVVEHKGTKGLSRERPLLPHR